jgi:hypothetical protein
MNNSDLQELEQLLGMQAAHKRENGLEYIWPEEHRALAHKHMAFINATKDYRTCVWLACNRGGKTFTQGTIVAYHATGKYPDWWGGRRFKKCTHVLVIGPDYDQLRNGIQKYLLGSFDEPGTGFIPKDQLLIDKCRTVHGVPGTYKLLKVRRATGEICTIEFGSADAGAAKYAGSQFNLVVIDEPIPLDLYSELLMRTTSVDNGDPNVRMGQMLINFTSVDGWIPILEHFLPNKDIPSSNIGPHGEYIVQMELDDIPNFILSTEQKQAMLATTPPHQLAARTTGVPSVGASAVYPVPVDVWTCNSFSIPNYWPRSYAVDPGIKNVGCVYAAMDPDSGVIYVYDDYQTYSRDDATNVAQSIDMTCLQIGRRLLGDWVIGAADPNSIKQLAGDASKRLLTLYRDNGLNLIRPEIINRETGITEVLAMLSSGKIQVFRDNCMGLIREITNYQRNEKGDPIRRNDHRVDALRYLVMAKNRIFRQNPELFDDEEESSYDTGKNQTTGY